MLENLTHYHLFAFASIAVATLRYITYFHTIYQGKTKPHAFSWFLWGIMTGVGTVAQFQMDAGPSAWALGFVSITCLFVAFISLFIGERDYTKSDWFALAACLITIPIWKLTSNPLYALSILIVIDVTTYWPTFRKSFNKPQTEPPISCFFSGLRYFLMLFAVPDPTWQTLIYPFFLMFMDWLFAAYIFVRRIQLNLPLHEYSAKAEKLHEHP